MKRLLFFITIFLSSLSLFAQGQKKGTETVQFKVEGNCEMCKKRIENAAYVNGVKRAEWNKESKVMTVTFRSSKTSAKAIQQHIARAGHDAGDEKAPEEAYNHLPNCCAYKTETATH